MSGDEEEVGQSFTANSDLFDAELEPEGRVEQNDEAVQDGEDEQEESISEKEENRELNWPELSSDEDEIVETRPKKSEKIREPKNRKAKKAAVQQMHSESQRLIRESSVRLPYHQPACKDISHFLKRVPVNNNNVKIKPKSKVSSVLSDEDEPTVKSDDDIAPPQPEVLVAEQPLPPVVVVGDQTDDAIADKVSVKPQLSSAFDDFFLDKPSTRKPIGVNHLMERFFQHNNGNTKKTKAIIEEPIEIPDDKNIEEKTEQIDDKKPKLKPIFSQGDKLASLKEKLQQNMKVLRAENRKIHESQRKLDNEEVSEEDEEEEFDEDEEDSDFELDEWNANDETEQERYKMEGNLEDDNDDDNNENANDDNNCDNDGDNTDDDNDINNKENKASSINAEKHNTNKHNKESSSFGLDRTKILEDKHPVKCHFDEQTIDLFSSDASNQNTNQTAESIDDTNGDSKDSIESIKLRLDSIDDTQDGTNMATFTKVKSPTFFKIQEQSSDGSSIQNGQEFVAGKKQNNFKTNGLTHFSSIKKLLGVDSSLDSTKEFKKSRPISELTLPVEDSQDLYDDDDGDDNDIRRMQDISISKDFHFTLDEDTQFTQFVDTQGYLLSANKKKSASENGKFEKANMSELLGLCSGSFSDKDKAKTDDSNKGNDMNELLGLCSGKFTGKTQEKFNFNSQKDSAIDFQSGHNSSKGDMSELLGLCSGRFSGLENSKANETKAGQLSEGKKEESGVFSGLAEQTNKKSRSKQGLLGLFDAMGNGNHIDDAVALCSGKFPTTQQVTKTSKDIEDSDEEESNGVEEDNNSSDEEDVFSDNENRDNSNDEGSDIERKIKAKKYGVSYGKSNKVFDKNNFLEDEAELSGSEFSSDEEENCGDDEFEEDSDIEDLPSDEELQRQVNKVHMKSVQDEDQQELRAFKERYLEDGDLHSEGNGRSRNFKWQGLEDSQMDMFENKFLWGDEEVVDSELLSQEELGRRKMKHEREQFMQQQIINDKIDSSQDRDMDENSQNILNLIKDTSSASGDVKKVIEKPTPKPKAPKTTNPLKRGSFLNRSKGQLDRLSSMTATKKAPNSTRGFVFQTVSPASKDKKVAAEKKIERSVSLSEPPNAKRPKLDRTFSEIATGSLFAMI